MKTLQEKAKKIIQKHYGLNRTITDMELDDEIKNIKRHLASGSLDDCYERLYIRLDMINALEVA